MSLRANKPIFHWNLDSLGWLGLDAIIAFGAMYAAYALSPSYNPAPGALPPGDHLSVWHSALGFAVIMVVSAEVFGLHDPLVRRRFWFMCGRSVAATLVALTAFSLYAFAVVYGRVGRLILGQTFLYASMAMVLGRALIWRISSDRKRRLLLFGSRRVAKAVYRSIKESELPLEVVSYVSPKEMADKDGEDRDMAVGGGKRLSVFCESHGIDEVINCSGAQVADETLEDLLECLNRGVEVREFSDFVERHFGRVPVEYLPGSWFLKPGFSVSRPIYARVKRVLDGCISAFGLILSGPILIVSAAAIKLESKGPALYSQVRIGQFNRKFRIWKLRTMHANAEANGVQWTRKDDDRVTWVGKVLRKTRLDELPQFWNILKGDMSFIGPRPERPEFVERLMREVAFYKYRHLVKPGLTGWTQINFPYGASVEDSVNKLKYDLFYVKYASPVLDLQIVLRTIGAVMKGAR